MMQDSTRSFHGACSGLSCIHNSVLRLVNLLQCLSSVRLSYLVAFNQDLWFLREKTHY